MKICECCPYSAYENGSLCKDCEGCALLNLDGDELQLMDELDREWVESWKKERAFPITLKERKDAEVIDNTMLQSMVKALKETNEDLEKELEQANELNKHLNEDIKL